MERGADNTKILGRTLLPRCCCSQLLFFPIPSLWVISFIMSTAIHNSDSLILKILKVQTTKPTGCLWMSYGHLELIRTPNCSGPFLFFSAKQTRLPNFQPLILLQCFPSQREAP